MNDNSDDILTDNFSESELEREFANVPEEPEEAHELEELLAHSEEGEEPVEEPEQLDLMNTELEEFASAEIEEEEEKEFLPAEQLESVLESLLFVSDRPLSLSALKQVFQHTTVTTRQIKKALDTLAVEFASAHRGVTLEEVGGGYRLHTKVDNMSYLKRMVKHRPFKLSGPAMEVMSIVAYKQPVVKAEIDQIRGVESGHLLRALMEKGLVNFAGKSDLPGKPMFYGTTRKFLEIFGLKSLKELPTLSEIDELLPEGIGEEEEKKPVLADLTESLSEQTGSSYSEGENELLKITDQLASIDTSSAFFEEEKQRQREKRDENRAKDIQEALMVGDEVAEKDKRWLERYLAKKAEAENPQALRNDGEETVPDMEVNVDGEDGFSVVAATKAIEAFESEDDEGMITVDTAEENGDENGDENGAENEDFSAFEEDAEPVEV